MPDYAGMSTGRRPDSWQMDTKHQTQMHNGAYTYANAMQCTAHIAVEDLYSLHFFCISNPQWC